MKQPNGSYIYSWRPPTTDEFNDNRLIKIGKNKQRQLVRGETRGIGSIHKLSERSCKLAWTLQIDVKGIIPPQLMNKSIHRALRPVFQTREKFDRDDEVDKMEREKLMDIMRSGYKEEVYDNNETMRIESVKSRMSTVPNKSFRPLDSPGFRTKMR